MIDKISIAIVDDEADAIDIIVGAVKAILNRHHISGTVDTFLSSEDFHKSLETHHYDLLMLDIDLSVDDGILFAKKLRKEQTNIDLVFVSNREERVFESFKVSPLSFIRKGNFIRDANDFFNNYLKSKTNEKEDVIMLSTKTSVQMVNRTKLVFVESFKDYQYLHIANEKDPIIIHSSMDVIEKELTPYGFIRIHKSTIVNYRYISKIEKEEVILIDNQVIRIAKRKVNEVLEAYMKLNREQIIASFNLNQKQ